MVTFGRLPFLQGRVGSNFYEVFRLQGYVLQVVGSQEQGRISRDRSEISVAASSIAIAADSKTKLHLCIYLAMTSRQRSGNKHIRGRSRNT